MNTSIESKFIILIFLIFLTQACLNPSQNDGKCTKCLQTENFEKGFCYEKISGCLQQTASTCVLCQVGYILEEKSCFRFDEYFQVPGLKLQTNPVGESQVLATKIEPLIRGGFQETTNFDNPTFVYAKDTLLSQYPSLADMKIVKVKEQVVNGIIYQFQIINTENNDIYVAKVFVKVKYEGELTEISKNNQNIMPPSPFPVTQPASGLWSKFTNLSDPSFKESFALVQKTYKGIEKYSLQRVQSQVVSGTNFQLEFVGPNSEKFTVVVYKPITGQPKIINESGTKPSVIVSPTAGGTDIMPVSEYEKEPFTLAFKVIQKLFINLKVKDIQKVQRQVVAGWIYIVTFCLPNSKDVYDVQVFVPLTYTANPPKIQSVKKNGIAQNLGSDAQNELIPKPEPILPIRGGYQDVINFNSRFYIQAKSDLLKKYPQLSTISLVKSQEQVVNGINYMFYFTNQKNGDQYVAQVYVDLNLKTTINSILKNNKSIKKDDDSNQDNTTPKVGAWQEFTNLTDSKFIASKNLLLTTFPTLSFYKLNRVESQVVSGLNLRFFFVDKNTNQQVFIAQVFYPLSGRPEIIDTWGGNNIKPGLSSPTEVPKAGARQKLLQSEFNEEPYLTAKCAIQTVFPDFEDALVKKAEKQVVSGWNLFVSFSYRNSADVYEVVVFIPLPYTGDGPEITSIKKNGNEFTPNSSSLRTDDEPMFGKGLGTVFLGESN